MEEKHLSGRAGWLRAAVLGADDGIVSVSSLMIGVAASSASKEAILIAFISSPGGIFDAFIDEVAVALVGIQS